MSRRVKIESKGTGAVVNESQEKVKRKRTITLKHPIKSPVKPAKKTGGRGLGKAGARRLGQLLKRAIQEKKHVTGNETMPKTPVRLFKFQTQAEVASTPKSSNTRHVDTLPRVSQLILRVISQCKHRGGISMVELKHALSAGGYDVTKNNTRVNLAVKGMVTRETLVQTTGAGASGSFKLNKKTVPDEKRHKMRGRGAAMKAKQKNIILNSAVVRKENSLRMTGKGLKQGTKGAKPAGKSKKTAGKSQIRAGKSQKTAGKSQIRAGKSQKTVGKSQKTAGKSQIRAGKSQKTVGKSQKTVGKSQKTVGKSQKTAGKSQKTAGKKRKTAGKKRVVGKAPRAARERPKQVGKSHKSAGQQAKVQNHQV
ncbi:histone H1.5 [Esox lucius]|uniref:H15 domain-containing protein n=1 Tax=Esox lucius TaxID=8010 RepID=A0AAY5L939_ESOLU|nr:histone H1.5 [Esox lucius]